MSSVGIPVERLSGPPDGAVAWLRRNAPLIVAMTLAELALAYLAFSRGGAMLVLGAVLAVEVLALCVFRPFQTLLVFAGLWGVGHVLLSGGEVEGGGGGGVGASVSQLVGVTVVLGFGLALVRGLGARGARRVPFPLRGLAVFGLLYGLAELITPLKHAGLSDLLKLVGGIVLAFVSYQVIDAERRLLALARVVGWTGVIVAAVGIAQYASGSSLGLGADLTSGNVYRVSSALGSANGTADFLLVTFGFVLLRYTLLRDRGSVREELASLSVIALGIVVTFTRADILALVVLLLVWASVWQISSVSALALRLRLVFVSSLIAVGIIQVVGGSALSARLEGRLHPTSEANLLNGREAIWSNELNRIQSASVNTILLGSGAHSSYTAVWIPQSEAHREFPPHDLFLWLVVETGVLGLIVYTSALVVLARVYLRAARRSRGSPAGRIAAVGLATGVAFVLDSMFHNTQLSTGSNWYFMLFIGATLRMMASA